MFGDELNAIIQINAMNLTCATPKVTSDGMIFKNTKLNLCKKEII